MQNSKNQFVNMSALAYQCMYMYVLFLFQSSDVTVYKLKDEIEDATSRLMFLLDYAIFPCKYLVLQLKFFVLIVPIITIDFIFKIVLYIFFKMLRYLIDSESYNFL